MADMQYICSHMLSAPIKIKLIDRKKVSYVEK